MAQAEFDFESPVTTPAFSPVLVSSEVPGLPFDGSVDAAFDYSAVGLSSAPNSVAGTTTGLGIRVNNSAGLTEGAGVAVALPAGDFKARFDAAIAYVSGPGATEHALFGLLPETIDAITPGTTMLPNLLQAGSSGLTWNLAHNEGGDENETHVRVQNGLVTPLYASSEDDLPTLGDLGVEFVGPAIFDSSGNDFPDNRWFTIEIVKAGGVVEAFINGVSFDRVILDETESFNTLVLGGLDIFSSVNSTNAIVYDNILIVPSPSTLVCVLGLGVIALARRARRAG